MKAEKKALALDQRQRDLAEKPVGRLLLNYAMPAIIAMSASSIYNICDSIFIGQGVDSMAIAGLAITFPLMNISSAFGAMLGVGSAALTSVRMGERNQKQAFQILGNMLRLDVTIGLCITIIGLLFLEPILRLFGASDTTLPYAKDYMEIILLGNVITHSFLGLNDQLRSSGNPRKAMSAQLLAVVVNIVLDYLFIFEFQWGMRGAAIATVCGQVCALCFELTHFFDKTNFVHFDREGLKLNVKIIREIISIGLSPFLLSVCSCVIVIALNHALLDYGGVDGDTYVAAYGIVNRIVMLLVMMVAGFSQGMQPIAGFNLGARQYERVWKVLSCAVMAAVLLLTMGFMVTQLFTRPIVMLFTHDAHLIEISMHALRIAVLTFPIVGIVMISTAFFQSIRMAKMAIFISVSRQMVFLLPLLLILPRFYGTDGVWYSLPISDLMAVIIASILLLRQVKRLKQKAREQRA